MDQEETFARVTESLGADGGDPQASLEALASLLAEALPDWTAVRWSGGGLLGRGQRRVRGLLVEVGATKFELELADGALAAFRQREVGGVAIQRAPLTLEEWVAELTADLRSEAARNAQARSALQRLLR